MDTLEHAADCWLVRKCAACGAGPGQSHSLDCPDGVPAKCECRQAR